MAKTLYLLLSIFFLVFAPSSNAALLDCKIVAINIKNGVQLSSRAFGPPLLKVGDIEKVDTSDSKWATTESEYKLESKPVSNSYRGITIDRATGAYQDKFLMDGSSLVISARCTKAEFKPVM